MSEPAVAVSPGFVETKEYRRFGEFCDAVRRYRYIGLCYGPPGVGKTLSARQYARWTALEPVLAVPAFVLEQAVPPALADCRTVIYTPQVTTTPKRLESDLQGLRYGLHYAVEVARQAGVDEPELAHFDDRWTELVIVDEADRLKFPTLEQLRDAYDRGGFGLVLVGMPGIEKRLARYPQLYSRVGFVHLFRALSAEETAFVLRRQWHQLGLALSADDFTDAEAVAAVVRITGGNFRLLHRLGTQIERIMEINAVRTVTREVVEAAREGLVIGPL